MKINLLTDAPKHNLALMKISAYHKARGDSVFLNFALMPADKTYASWIFDWSMKFRYDIAGGPGVDPSARLPEEIETMKPDYSLYPNIDYSLGYTWRACPRRCSFCKVGDMWQEKEHHSIFEFHDPKFKKICLLNNNTFMDPQWRETLDEIHYEGLTIVDENGYDARLLDEEKTYYLKGMKFERGIHFAWDKWGDKKQIISALELLKENSMRCVFYVLMGYDTTFEQDLERCQIIHDYGCDPYPMLYKENDSLKAFRRMIYLRYYKRYKTIKKAWENYK